PISEPCLIDHRIVEIIGKRHEEDVRWVNKMFFSGKPCLSVAGESLEVSTNSVPRETTNEIRAAGSIETLLFRWAIRELVKLNQENHADLSKRMLAAIGD